MEIIKISDLNKTYKDVVAVANLNLEINEYELFGLLGINGAGKTTTIKMLSCLLKPTSGDAIIDNHSILTGSEYIKSIIGYSTQETAIAKNLTVKENLEFYASLYNLEKEEIKLRCDSLIKQFSLEKVLNKRVKKLSGGYQRKVSIALALISKPKILFLDEPTLGLDVIARHELWNIINELKKDTTIILTTHYLEEAESLCDRVAVMVDGKLKALDTPSNLVLNTNASNFEDAFIKIAGGETYENN
jgi:ABC-2 type transport system ATP-binding protein